MMKPNIITAPEYKFFPQNSIKIFLAGGICRCVDWQTSLIKYFKVSVMCGDIDMNNIYILNPRRAEWLPDDSADEQVEWEFDMIERCDIFTMYFAGGVSDQPICMYELGRNIERMKAKFPDSWWNRIVIACDDRYKRTFDVKKQVWLATGGKVEVNVVMGENESITTHCESIEKAMKNLKKEG